MRILLPWAAMLAFVPLTVCVHVAAQTKAPAKKPVARTVQNAKTAQKKTTSGAAAKKGTAGKSTQAARKGTRKAGPRAPAVTWRNRQNTPSPERYRDIQSALAAKGYLPADKVNGQWDQASVDALKRFQSEQSLDASGKVNSLSLIALGLGPKHEAKALPPPPAPASQP